MADNGTSQEEDPRGWPVMVVRAGTRLYHGTGEKFGDDVQPGGYDGLAWFALDERVARAYIPSWGLSTRMSFPLHRMHEPYSVFTHGRYTNPTALAIVKAMGFEYEIGDHYGSYIVRKTPTGKGAKNIDVVRYLRRLGYAPKRDQYDISFEDVGISPEGPVIPASKHGLGSLHVYEVVTPLRLYDLARGQEGDQTKPEYNQLGTFGAADKEGFDGAHINDFLQSKHWDNFGHKSIGLFTRGLKKIRRVAHAPSTRFDAEDLDAWR